MSESLAALQSVFITITRYAYVEGGEGGSDEMVSICESYRVTTDPVWKWQAEVRYRYVAENGMRMSGIGAAGNGGEARRAATGRSLQCNAELCGGEKCRSP